jgi:putative phosphoribosyl transferase
MRGGGSFRDREDAGRRLAERLSRYREESPVVLALPRGGVPVGYEVARALKAPLDVFIARKLGAPGREEFGIGAVAQGGVRVLNERAIQALNIPEGYIERTTKEETEEIERRLKLLRGEGRSEPEVGGRTAILVDDGLATGMTARAAIEALRRRSPQRLILAVPVCAEQMAETLRSEVDELVCLEAPSNLVAIGHWYEDFYQVPDREVVELLKRAKREQEERSVTGLEGRA